jgi:hypothetical protein
MYDLFLVRMRFIRMSVSIMRVSRDKHARNLYLLMEDIETLVTLKSAEKKFDRNANWPNHRATRPKINGIRQKKNRIIYCTDFAQHSLLLRLLFNSARRGKFAT